MRAKDTRLKPLGVVLAGGAGRRIGGDKATVEIDGVALIHYPIAALRAAVGQVAVVAKRDTVLPALAGRADVWIEPDEPRHPLCGVVHALRLAAGRPVLIVAADLALVDAATLRAIAATEPGVCAAVVPRAAGRLQPLCALYTPAALAGLARYDPVAGVADVVSQIGARIIDFDDDELFLNVNAPEDVLVAAAALARRRVAG